MFNKIKNITLFFFGKNQKIRFRRIIFFIFMLASIVILLLNISFGYDKNNGWFFKWTPAADIKIEKKI